jgi:hypothetical protein
MHNVSRTIGLGYIVVCLLALAGKAFVPLSGPFGYAPLAIPIGPAGQPIDVVVWYGTEKQEWLEETARRFEASAPSISNRPIRIQLKGLGSREMVERVAQQDWGNDAVPTVVSPASSLWIEVLKSDWAARNGTPIVGEGAEATQLLVLAPLVVVAWEERANVLWNNDPNDFWPMIHNALANEQGWIGVAAERGFAPNSPEAQQAAQWGLVKFGHTSPLTSNSGAQALILLAYGYHNKSSGLSSADIVDPAFQQWLSEVETAVLEFGDSTGTFMTNMVQFGPSKYDLVVVYENLAIENIEAAQNRWGQNIRVYYPPATLFSDHPYTILQDPLTTPEQRAAAAQFRDFLLAQPNQELALQFGFRPADPNVAVITNDPNNPFNKYAQYGVKVDIAQQVQIPSGDVINTLLDVWRRYVNR